MPLSPIITKIVVPPRSPDVLHRERLVDFLHEHIDRKLILVSAPAGYGKTTLLVDFAHETDLAVCWYTLDPTDCDPRVFMDHLLVSLARRFPGFGEQTRRVLKAGGSPGGGAIEAVGTLVNEMVSAIPEWFVLILDDFHSVEASSEVPELLTALLSYQPEHFHLIIASRTVPGTLPVISLAAREEIAGVGRDELRFTPEEIQALFLQGRCPRFSLQEAQKLAAESEGWITAILLTSHTLWPGALDVWARARASGQPLYDYLAGEVLNRQAPDLRAFLLASSTLEEMSPVLCAGALGLEEAERWLGQLERRNLFAVRLEGGKDHFRYHDLFREFLQARLERDSPETFRNLHRQAATWFEEQGEAERAARHHLAAEEPATAARVIEQAVQTLLRAGHLETLVGWAERLPGEVLRSRPRLVSYAAEAACGAGRVEQAAAWLDMAEATYRERGEGNSLALVLSAQARLRLNQGWYTDCMRLTEEALSLPVPDQAGAAKATVEARRIRGICLVRLGRLEEAEHHLRAALEGSREIGDLHFEALVRLGLAACLEHLGRMEDAAQSKRAAVETCRRLGSSGLLAEALNDLAYCLYLSGEYAEAMETLQEALDTAREIGHRPVEAFTLVSLGEMLRDLGDPEAAVEALMRGLEIAGELDQAFLSAFGREALALAYLRLEDTRRALELAQEAVSLAEQHGAGGQTGRCQATLGLIQVEVGEIEEGTASLEKACALLEQVKAGREIARAQLFLAHALYRAGREEAALEMLAQALGPYLNAGLEHRLLLEGQPATPLLERAVAEGIGGARLAAVLEGACDFQASARRVLRQHETAAPSPPPSFRVYGFGASRVERDGVLIPLDEWRSATARHLLVYLLLHPPRTREQIGADFWPDLQPARLSGTFHNTKYRMQRALGVNPVVHQKGLYFIDDDLDIWLDVSEFERLLERARRSPPLKAARYIRQAIALYTGDFLEHCYADWCVARRERLQQQFLETVGKLAGWLLRRRRLDEVLPLLRRGLEVDSLREDFHRQLMRAYALDGRSEEALAQYRRCVRLLKRELKTVPTPETEELFRTIRKGRFPPPNG